MQRKEVQGTSEHPHAPPSTAIWKVPLISLGGATALLFYAEPALTYDVDVFLLLPGDQGASRLLDLGPLYRTLEAKGYRAEKEHLLIEGIPVQ